MKRNTLAALMLSVLVIMCATTADVPLTWTPGSETDIEYYNLYKAPTMGGTYAILGTSTTNSFTDTGALPSVGDRAWYKFAAVDACGNEAPLSDPQGWVRDDGQPPAKGSW